MLMEIENCETSIYTFLSYVSVNWLGKMALNALPVRE